MSDEQEEKGPETKEEETEESSKATIDEKREQLAQMYLNFLDKQKGGIIATWAWIGVNLNPLQKDAIEYMTTDQGKKDKDIFKLLWRNIKKKLVEQFTWGTIIEYDKIKLNKMKSLITQYKDNQAKLQELMTQIESGNDPTTEAAPDNAQNQDVPSQTPTTVPAAWIAAAGVAAEMAFENHEIKREDYAYPIPGAKISSPVWPRTLPWIGHHIHQGIDISIKEWTPILSIEDAEVESVGMWGPQWFSGYGNYMQVKLRNGYRVLYAHMVKHAVKADGTERKVGDKIKKGEQVGLVGNTWLSKGDHLHLEIRDGTFDDVKKNFFSRKVLDPIAILPVTKSMVDSDVLARVDDDKFMSETEGSQIA